MGQVRTQPALGSAVDATGWQNLRQYLRMGIWQEAGNPLLFAMHCSCAAAETHAVCAATVSSKRAVNSMPGLPAVLRIWPFLLCLCACNDAEVARPLDPIGNQAEVCKERVARLTGSEPEDLRPRYTRQTSAGDSYFTVPNGPDLFGCIVAPDLALIELTPL